MCAGETREAAFWESLHATTTRGTGPTFTVMSDSAIKAALYGDAGNSATTPDDGSQVQRQADMRLSSRLVDTYDFLAEVDQEGGNHLLPFLDEVDPSVSTLASHSLLVSHSPPADPFALVQCPPQFDYNSKQGSAKREPKDERGKRAQPGPQNSTPPGERFILAPCCPLQTPSCQRCCAEDGPTNGRQTHGASQDNRPARSRQKPEQLATEPEPSTADGPGDRSLRRGLRPRSKPKQYKVDESEESDGEWSPKRKKGSRKRSRGKKEEDDVKSDGESSALASTGQAGRQERPLPPDLDEKQRRRILRNRASAERSRLKRLGQIAMLEQENQELKRQLAEAQRAANGNGAATSQTQSNLMHENSMLRCGAGLST